MLTYVSQITSANFGQLKKKTPLEHIFFSPLLSLLWHKFDVGQKGGVCPAILLANRLEK